MDKKDYKLAYDYIYNLLNLDEESMKWPLTIDSMSIFKELVDEKLNNPTLEQVKQEWGEKGWYVLRDTKDYLTFFSHEDGFGVHDYDCKIKISKKSKEYEASMTGGYGVMPYFITFELHQLITKTIRALERKEKI